MGDSPRIDRTRGAESVGFVVAFAYAMFGYLRYRTYTNQTFDLAFYARMAWGLVHGNAWDPIVGAHVLGLHVSPVLLPVGLVGLVVGTPLALHLAQGVAAGLAVVPLARLGERRFGAVGAWAGALGFVLHPNLGHVLSFEAHPGTLALLPLAHLVDSFDRRSGRGLVLASLGVLACREDLALVVICAALLGVRDPTMRRASLASLAIATAWLLVFALVLHPIFKPANGSMEAHFGPWGRSIGEVARTLATEPTRLVAHLAEPKRLSYLPRILAPLALLPLLAPRFLFIAAPILGVALVSFFSTTTRIDSHYMTPALPMLVGGALVGARTLADRWPRVSGAPALAIVLASALGTAYAGLFSYSFPTPLFAHPPVDRAALDRLVHLVPARASVEAPDALLAHFAERSVVHRPRPFAGDDEAIVLDLSHRERFAHSEDLLRTTEEPRARAVFARPSYRVASVAGPYVLLLRDARSGPTERIDRVRIPASSRTPVPLTACLALLRAQRLEGRLALDFVARGPCPEDLAIRLGVAPRPSRVDLLFEGLVSPSHLRAGDFVRSMHDDPVPGARSVHVGLLRSSGARPDPSDPTDVPSAIESHRD